MRKTKLVSNVALITLAVFFLIGSISLQGLFAQEIKKPRPQSSPFLSTGTEGGEVFAPKSFKAQMHAGGENSTLSSKKDCPKGKKLVVDFDKGPYFDIQSAINAALDGDKIEVMPGTYGGFIVDGKKCLKIKGKRPKKDDGSSDGKSHDDGPKIVIVTGSVSVSTYRGTYSLTIGVVDSTDVEISNLTVQAGYTDPFTIAYFNSTGKVKNNDVGGNTGNSNPGNGIAAFGITSPGTVKIEHNDVHDYGKISILVSSWDLGIGAYVSGGIHAKIKRNTIIGTDFAVPSRVQDGIQVTYGGNADIEHNDISANSITGGSYWTCDGLLLYDAHQVTTKKNKIYNNDYGITIQKYVTDAKLKDDDITDNGWGIYTWNWVPSIIEVKKAKIKENEYGWVNWDTDGIVFDHCKLKKNEVGMYASAYLTVNPTATFNHCKITKNTVTDVEHDSNTLIFHKTKYDTYVNNGGGILIEN